MKCPKCGYVSYNHLGSCKKCKSDLSEHKDKMGIWGVEPGTVNLLYLEQGGQPQEEGVPAEEMALPHVSLEEPGVTLEELETDLTEEEEEAEPAAHEIPLEEEMGSLMGREDLALDLSDLEMEAGISAEERTEREEGIEVQEEEEHGGIELEEVEIGEGSKEGVLDLSVLDEDLSLEDLEKEGLRSSDEAEEEVEISEELEAQQRGIEVGEAEFEEEKGGGPVDLSGLDEELSLEELKEEMAAAEEGEEETEPAISEEKQEAGPELNLEEIDLDFSFPEEEAEEAPSGASPAIAEEVEHEGKEREGPKQGPERLNADDFLKRFQPPARKARKGLSIDLSQIEGLDLEVTPAGEERAEEEIEGKTHKTEPKVSDLGGIELVQDKAPSGKEPTGGGIAPPAKEVSFELEEDWLPRGEKKEEKKEKEKEKEEKGEE